ncbi:MAG: VanZ family protein [Deltaproteobacteria bacterium]|nr:VanZ family protein [Deltaproteobacteria bacterium]
MNKDIIRQGMLPFLFACANLALIQPGPALAASAARLMGKAYSPAIWGICIIIGSYVLIKSLRKNAIGPGWICLIASGSLAVITLQMTVCMNEFFHLFQYGILGYLLVAMSSLGSMPAMIVGAIFGIADELIQAVLPGRFFEIRDILMNLIAVAGGIITGMTYGISPRSDVR